VTIDARVPHRFLAPAKVNLHLRVGPPRPDGFHPLLSWMCTVGLFDTLEIRFERAGDAGIALAIDPASATPADDHGARPSGQGGATESHVPVDGRNLVVRAADAWVRATAVAGEEGSGRPALPGRVSVVLGKRIPVGAGLGGGSSDAARTLLALDAIAAVGGAAPTSRQRLCDLAATLGSDVPFFVFGPSAACRGRGEVVTPITPPRPRWAVLVLPPVHMPTPAVYRQFDAMGLGRNADVDAAPEWAAWARLPATELLPLLVNDLEPPAFALRPDLGELRLQCERVVERPVRMSGSGSSLFTLFDDEQDARAAAARLTHAVEVRTEAVELCPHDELTQRPSA